ncbi:hypothetical protein [uncultured Muriicola sp.]|uniref:hypothetical protein n=1 Tax=uncultured Muriicola sp. TaxID=1583102 RepID=UPI0026357694|nr:hypothetical protein [uncultured Muriicola sp.]
MNDDSLSNENDVAFILFNKVGNDNLASEKERRLVKRLNTLENVADVKISDLNTLKAAFSAAASDDPYYISPTYYALTGRRGLYLYKNEDQDKKPTTFLFCIHPNIQNTILAFPPFGHNPAQAINSLVEELRGTGIRFQLGRVSSNSDLCKTLINDNDTGFRQKIEDTLDWTYPLHTVNCQDLTEHKGKNYSRIRQVMNKFRRSSALTRDIDFSKDHSLIDSLSQNWEDNTNHYENYDIKFTEYFQHLVSMANNEPALNLRGLIVSIDGVNKGFSIWEPPQQRHGAANLFASQVTDFEITNLATYLTVKSAERMLEEGTERMCLGGSENIGMDTYKRGFVPEKTLEMQTLELDIPE